MCLPRDQMGLWRRLDVSPLGHGVLWTPRQRKKATQESSENGRMGGHEKCGVPNVSTCLRPTGTWTWNGHARNCTSINVAPRGHEIEVVSKHGQETYSLTLLAFYKHLLRILGDGQIVTLRATEMAILQFGFSAACVSTVFPQWDSGKSASSSIRLFAASLARDVLPDSPG
ncbi:hypothetical protein CI102_1924 [Trichoderma harzianum]|nr:hypothetical protein CI102_1924 [Trichoderma harzianum]